MQILLCLNLLMCSMNSFHLTTISFLLFSLIAHFQISCLLAFLHRFICHSLNCLSQICNNHDYLLCLFCILFAKFLKNCLRYRYFRIMSFILSFCLVWFQFDLVSFSSFLLDFSLNLILTLPKFILKSLSFAKSFKKKYFDNDPLF